jgi:hypothetical protein
MSFNDVLAAHINAENERWAAERGNGLGKKSPAPSQRFFGGQHYAGIGDGVPREAVAGIVDLANNIQRSQAQHLQGMANDTMDALEKENYSRVSQAREARRQDHELRMQKMALDAMLARVAMERQSAEEQRQREAKMRFDAGMGGTRTLRNGGWDYS